VPGPKAAGRFDIADIVRDHRAQLESGYTLSRSQRRVLTDIASCRTAALGGHLDRCTRCGHEHPSYNSCRDRHCPKCQALAQEKWIDEQRTRMLDIKHFHVVFTLPAQLRPLAAFAPRSVLHALFAAASRTLLEFGDSRLGATIGATLVLHTWTRDLRYHPHVHCIVTGGGLASDGQAFHPARGKYLFPVKAMSRVFRGKMIEALKQIHHRNGFDGFTDFQDPEGFDRLVGTVARLRWNVYAKATFSAAKHVIQYLGRYTHRVGIANSRLLRVTADQVTFRTKGSGTATLAPVEFLRRFVLHVLPDGFHKIRHIGLYASTDKRDQVREILGIPAPTASPSSWRQRLEQLTGRDVGRCPVCSGPMISVALPAVRDGLTHCTPTRASPRALARSRDPPEAAA